MTGLSIPTGAMPAAALPRPTRWEVVDGPLLEATTGPVFVRRPDDQVVPEQWLLTFENLSPVAANGIRAHARDHVGAFAWANPETGTVEQWRHSEPPVVTFETAARASASVTLERLTVHE